MVAFQEGEALEEIQCVLPVLCQGGLELPQVSADKKPSAGADALPCTSGTVSQNEYPFFIKLLSFRYFSEVI